MYTLETGEPHQKLKSNMFSLSGDGFLGAVGRSINLGEPNILFVFCWFLAYKLSKTCQ